MPRISRKTELINNLCINYCLEMAAVDTSDEEEEAIEKFNSNIFLLLKNRRTAHFHIPKSNRWRSKVLDCFDEDRMRHMLRVNRKEFDYILRLIKKDPVFKNKKNVAQMPVELQLQIVLYRLGCSGESASIKKCASLFGVGDGGTLQKITNRVIAALLNLKSKFLVWPTASERLHLQQAMFSELPGCIGYIDGTEIRLAEAPARNHELFYSRKRQYAVKLQIVCDYKLRIRQTTIGNPGSVHDAKIFANSPIARSSERLFSGSQWIAGDSAYPQKPFLLTPFRQNSRELTREQREHFNKYFSKYRVRVENCIGHLKEKFGSLKELRFRLNNGLHSNECNNWIMACCVLHNILIEHNDPVDETNSMEYCTPFELSPEQNLRSHIVNYVLENV